MTARRSAATAAFLQVRQGLYLVELRGFEPLTFSLRRLGRR